MGKLSQVISWYWVNANYTTKDLSYRLPSNLELSNSGD